MSKKLTSRTGSEISFLVRGTSPLLIPVEGGVTVSDSDADFVFSRLGENIMSEDTQEVVPAVEVAPADEPVVETPVVAPEVPESVPPAGPEATGDKVETA